MSSAEGMYFLTFTLADVVVGVLEMGSTLVPRMEADFEYIGAPEDMVPLSRDDLTAIGRRRIQVAEDSSYQLNGQAANDVELEGATTDDSAERSPLVRC